jgi:formylglycine-generating enzyme required for sulfatase activity
MKTRHQALCALVACALSPFAAASVNIEYVTVGNPGNVADPLTGYGSVGYSYNIGKYEVTNAQYGEFLNAKGQSNANGIYNSSMSSYGITQTGSSGNYTYSVTGALANRPVVYVSWFDAARFANWLSNGQGSGDMEDGAYTIDGASNGVITANIGAEVYLTSENEWYKAAYYNAATTSYSLYPNGKNTISTADSNYSTFASTDVGTYSNAASSYGTFDQGGNVWEWSEAISDPIRVFRGGAFIDGHYVGSSSPWLASSDRLLAAFSDFENGNIGFRVASGFSDSRPTNTSIPEPTSAILTMLAGGILLIRRKR